MVPQQSDPLPLSASLAGLPLPGGLFKSVDQVISGIYLITAWHWSACPQRQRPFPMISMRYPDQNRPHQGKTVALLSYYRPDAHADAGTRLPRPRNAIRALE